MRSEPAGHLLLGLVGLAAVWGTFWSVYRHVVGVTVELLGGLSATAIVWLFLVTWFLVWIGLEVLGEYAG